ncbi:MAG: PDZ domain-containing protein, partial [Candidatus Kapaibacteriota bacterium]
MKGIPNNLFKPIFFLSALLLIGIGVYLQFVSISLPTDENFFSNPPSRILNLEAIAGFHFSGNNSIFDTIPAGSLIVSINNIELGDTFLLKSLKNSLSEPLNVKFYDRVRNLLRSMNVEKQVFFNSKFEYLKSAVIIFWIKSNGASQRSGLKPGDIIISINGRTFNNSAEADNILINAPSEKPILYEILRGIDKLEVKVSLTSYNVSFDAVCRYFVAAIYLFFSLLLGLKHSDSLPIRLLSFAFLFISVVLLLVYTRFGENLIFNKIWLYVEAFALCFSFAFLSHFLLYFPVEQINLLKRKGIVASIYSIASVLFFAIVLSIAFKSNILTEFLTNFSFLPILAHRLALSLFF